MTAGSRRRWAVRLGVPSILAIVASACVKNAPQDALAPEGPIARQQDALFKPVFWIAVAIFFLVEGLILFAVFKFRDRPGRPEPKQIHGNSRLEFTWTLIPAMLLAGIAVPTVATILDLSEPPQEDDLVIKVVGHQWWWEYQYDTNGDDQTDIYTANELVIPTNREVFLRLESADVVHSYWVPKLAGKQDVVPGRTNMLRLIADKPGRYAGQCAEFCAVSHANMRLWVEAKSPGDYDAWLRDQQAPAAEPSAGSLEAQGRELFKANACIGCHAIRGLEGAEGRQAPDLTHLASRQTFAGSMFELNEENLVEWIRNAPKRKQGVVMPPFPQFSDEQLRALAAYLLTLK